MEVYTIGKCSAAAERSREDLRFLDESAGEKFHIRRLK